MKTLSGFAFFVVAVIAVLAGLGWFISATQVPASAATAVVVVAIGASYFWLTRKAVFGTKKRW